LLQFLFGLKAPSGEIREKTRRGERFEAEYQPVLHAARIFREIILAASMDDPHNFGGETASTSFIITALFRNPHFFTIKQKWRK
jgi:hypothetical protein